MTYHIDIQHAFEGQLPISDEQLQRWVELVLQDELVSAELTVRLVDRAEMTTLNYTYRQQNKPTNVLAFPSSLPSHIELEYPFLGDIIICPTVLVEESQAQKKALDAHWALIVIHGVLHLLGYDHIEQDEAILMQNREIHLLNRIGFDNPYGEDIGLE